MVQMVTNYLLLANLRRQTRGLFVLDEKADGDHQRHQVATIFFSRDFFQNGQN